MNAWPILGFDLAEWFGEDEIPRACEICASGEPVAVAVGDIDLEVLGACAKCMELEQGQPR